MKHEIKRVVVDECCGPESPLLEQLCRRLGNRPLQVVFIGAEHPGIPDVEILDKLLDARSALLTHDRVLHNLAIGRGFRSFVYTPDSGLTDRRLAHVDARDKGLPVSRSDLQSSYTHQPDAEAQAIIGCVAGFLSEHQLKQFRTKRRRIRAHFGSVDNIAATMLTIGQRRASDGIVGGYVLKVDGRLGVKTLFPASESYFLDRSQGDEPLRAACWALAQLFQLQLTRYPLTLYLINGAALARCTALLSDWASATSEIEQMAARLLAAVSRPEAQPCVKGRFFDRLDVKLRQLSTLDSNELVPADLQAIATALCRADAKT